MSADRIPRNGIMNEARVQLARRLASKGMESNETELFIKDVLRIATDSSELDIHAIKGQLHLLGWHEDYTDYGTIQLVQACYQDNLYQPL